MKKEGREGPKGKISLLLPLVAGTEQGEGRTAPALIPAQRGTAAAGIGAKERGREAGLVTKIRCSSLRPLTNRHNFLQ